MSADVISSFLKAATWHGGLDDAQAMLAKHPELATASIHTASVLGDDKTLRAFLDKDPKSVSATAAPYGAEPLVYLCLSKYLRLEPNRTESFLRAAAVLLDAGADPKSGFLRDGEFETALYGAAGVAHHAEMTRLLIDRGAKPDDEVVYHAAEEYDLAALKVLVESGSLTPDQLSLLLVRKHDWHDYEGIKYLLARGADSNRQRGRGFRALHHAIARDNDTPIIELLLDHGADPSLTDDGITAVQRAARRGRGDVLKTFARRGFPTGLHGADELLAACATNDADRVRAIAEREPALVRRLVADGGQPLALFAGNGNLEGVRLLLDLGVPVTALYKEGSGYSDTARDSMALHVAAWCANHDVVKLLIQRAAPVNAKDGQGRTPLMRAVSATVDSYWTERRKPDSVRALLDAGASVEGVRFPSGYDEVDALLRQRGARPPR